MKILLLGANGQVGGELRRSLSGLGQVIVTTRSGMIDGLACETADFNDPDSLPGLVERVAPDIVVNAAAYTAVDRAEQEADAAPLSPDPANGATLATAWFPWPANAGAERPTDRPAGSLAANTDTGSAAGHGDTGRGVQGHKAFGGLLRYGEHGVAAFDALRLNVGSGKCQCEDGQK